jgi:hypothetical protein
MPAANSPVKQNILFWKSNTLQNAVTSSHTPNKTIAVKII